MDDEIFETSRSDGVKVEPEHASSHIRPR